GTEARERTPRLDEPVLRRVLGVGGVARDEVGHSECGLEVRADEVFERWTALHASTTPLAGPRVPVMPAKLVGINHVALEVGDIDEALAWYAQFFEFELRGRAGVSMAFVDMGDQFLALARDN